jgi:hypothetical protein
VPLPEAGSAFPAFSAGASPDVAPAAVPAESESVDGLELRLA